MSRTADLDAYRHAVAEADGEAPRVVLGGETFVLPTELPYGVAVYLRRGEPDKAYETLFGDKFDAVLKAGLTVKDLDRIASDCYGLTVGESEASAG